MVAEELPPVGSAGSARKAACLPRKCCACGQRNEHAALFARRLNPHRKFDNENVKQAVFSILHQPPSNFDINRTTWKIRDLSRVIKETGTRVSEDVIRKIVKQAGYRWRKARVVLTSNDPNFSAKLDRIGSILSRLGADEVLGSEPCRGPDCEPGAGGEISRRSGGGRRRGNW